MPQTPNIPAFILILLAYNSFASEIEFTPKEKEWIKSHPVVEYGYEPNWEPYEVYESGVYTGIVGEYVKRIEELTGIDFQPIKNITWNESFEGLKSGRIKMVPSCGITESRKKLFSLTTPYLKDPFIICTRRDYEFIAGFQDLTGKTITVPKDYYTKEIIESRYPDIKILEAKNIRDCMDKVSFGEADAFVGSLGVVSYYINHKGFANLKVSAPTKLEDIEICMAFTKDWTILRDICQKALDQISLQERSRIRKDWISVRYEYAINWNRAFLITAIVVGAAILIIGLFYLWNRTLSKEIKAKEKLEKSINESLKEIKHQNEEKTILLQEVHHRVKNNLQIITSMIRLQASTSNNLEVHKHLQEASERIQAIALTHEKIYKSPDLSKISSEDYLKTLTDEIISSYQAQNRIKVIIDAKDLYIDLNIVVPLALILNELITNTLKHAYKPNEKGEINIEVKQTPTKIYFNYSDTGKWKEVSPDSNEFGTSLIEIFTEQLEGTYEVDKTDHGTFFKFKFVPKF